MSYREPRLPTSRSARGRGSSQDHEHRDTRGRRHPACARGWKGSQEQGTCMEPRRRPAASGDAASRTHNRITTGRLRARASLTARGDAEWSCVQVLVSASSAGVHARHQGHRSVDRHAGGPPPLLAGGQGRGRAIMGMQNRGMRSACARQNSPRHEGRQKNHRIQADTSTAGLHRHPLRTKTTKSPRASR